MDAEVNVAVDAAVDAADGRDADATLAKEPVEAPLRPPRPSRCCDDLMDVESIQDDNSAHAVADAVLRPQRVAPALPTRLA